MIATRKAHEFVPLVCLVALICAGGTTSAADGDLSGIDGNGAPAERLAVREALLQYLRVVDERDKAAVTRAFHPTGLLMSVSHQGALRFVTLDEWWERVSAIPGDTPERRSVIRLIDVSGLAAVARIDVTSGQTGDTTTDYFNLQKVDEGWRIVNKTLSAPIGRPRRTGRGN